VSGGTHNVQTYSEQFLECNVKLKLHETSALISDIKKRKMPTVSFKQQQFHKALQSQFHETCQDGINTGLLN
jgi:hypothetical protein